MAVARRNARGNQNQQQAHAPAPAPPAPPQPQQAPVVAPVQPPAVPVAPPPAPPAPRPIAPRNIAEMAAMRLLVRGEEVIEEAERRDNARRMELEARSNAMRAELEEAERRRQAFWRAVRMVVGIIVLVGIAVMVTMFIMATPTSPASPPPVPVVITTAQPTNSSTSIGMIEVNCRPGVICTAENCLGDKDFGRNSSLACCNSIENKFHRTRCLSIRNCMLEHRPGPARDTCIAKAGG